MFGRSPPAASITTATQATGMKRAGAERLALAGALLMVLLHALGAGSAPLLDSGALEYRAADALREPWRLITGHLVHINWPHTLINAAAWWVVARLYAPELPPRRQLAVLGASALAIGLGLAVLHPTIVWYRGFSGVLHALFFAGGVQWLMAALRGPRTWRALWLPAVLVAGGALKVALEQPAGSATPYADWLGAGTVPQAHLLGALTGTVFGVAWGAAAARRRPERASRAN
jgi:rhomboid family GlyGly-CTERM serine protease